MGGIDFGNLSSDYRIINNKSTQFQALASDHFGPILLPGASSQSLYPGAVCEPFS